MAECDYSNLLACNIRPCHASCQHINRCFVEADIMLAAEALLYSRPQCYFIACSCGSIIATDKALQLYILLNSMNQPCLKGTLGQP